jgi:hypothetical protein
MTQTSWPFEGVDTTETQYSRLLRNIGQGVNGVPGDNNLLVYADSSGMNVKVKIAGGLSQAIVRGHMYQSTAEETLTISAAASSPRIDAVVLRLDPSVNSIVLAVVAGTPAVSPSAPNLTQTDTAVYELLLAHVSVPASATTISAANVTDKRTFIENVWTTANRKPAFLGLTGFNTTIGKLETYTGSAWEVVTPTSLDASVLTSGTVDSNRLPTISVAKGGTGATDASTARTNLGAAASSHTHDASAVVSGTIGTDRLPTIPVTSGGTGATSASSARSNLGITPGNIGAAASSHTHDGSQIVSGNIDVPGSLRGTYISVNNNAGGSAVTMASNGNVAIGGTLNVSSAVGIAGGLYATDVYNTSVTYGAYRAVWVNVDGRLGNTASTKTVKQDITPADIPSDAVLGVEVVNFRYIDAVEALGDKAPIEIGVIAEQLLEVPGMEKFVYFDDDKPAGVHYERLAIAVIPQLQKQAALISELEARISAIESVLPEA